MMDLIKGEIYKMCKSNLCRVLFIIFVVTGIAMGIFANKGDLVFENNGDEDLLILIIKILKEIPKSGGNANGVAIFLSLIIVLGIISSLFIVPVFTSMFISAEYSTRSFQQLVGKGTARHRIVLSKFIVMSLFIVIMNLGITLFGFISTSVVYGIENLIHFIVPILVFIIKIALMNLVFMAIGTFMAYCFKSSSASMPVSFIIMVYIFSAVGEMLVSENSILCMAVFLLITGVFLTLTIIMFNKSDIH